MPDWTQHDLHPHMQVYSTDNQNLGHIAEIYPDSFLVHKGFFFPKDRYIPYSAIKAVEDDRVVLSMSADEADPTQLFYDRGHGVSDPFDEENPDRT